MASDNKTSAFDFNTIIKSYPDIFEQIVKNIPLHLRWDVAAVNRDFYDMICKMDKKKHPIFIKGDKNCCKEILEGDMMASMLNSDRVIDLVRIWYLNFNPQLLQQLIKIAEKFGNDIIHLDCVDCKIDFQKDIQLLMKFFKKLPNLQVLRVYDRNDWKIQEDEISSIPFKPVLKNLYRFVSCGGSAHIISKFIAKDTLVEYLQESGRLFDYAEFIRNQANLARISVMEQSEESSCRKIVNIDLYKHLNLSEFSFGEGIDQGVNVESIDKDLFVQQLIRDHPGLCELNFYHRTMKWNSTTIETICEHGEDLETLSLTMDEENCRSFLKLDRLEQLEEITITIDEVESGEEDENDEQEESILCNALVQLSKLNMPSVQTFNLYVYRTIRSDVGEILMNLSNNWSNLEELGCNFSSGNETTNPNLIDTILPRLNMLNTLKLNNSSTKKIDDGEIYLNLKHLELEQKTDEASVVNIVKAFPNLCHLRISLEDVDSNLPVLIQRISTLNKLKYLRLTVSLKWTDDMSSSSDLYDANRNLCLGVPEFWIWFKDEESLDKLIAYWTSRDTDFCKIKILKDELALENLKY